MSASLLARLHAGREEEVALPNGRTVRVRRPPETAMPALLMNGELVEYLRCVVGWGGGWTEADVLGSSGDASKAAPFDVELWVELARDHAEWAKLVAKKVQAMCLAFTQAKEAASGN